MRNFFVLTIVLPCLFFSCTRVERGEGDSVIDVTHPVEQAVPLAIVRAGKHPLWFQLKGEGPVLIESIADAEYSAALIPWPLAPHISFFLARGKDLMAAVDRDGFLYFSPREGGQGTGLYHFSGGDFWKEYTLGAFVLVDDKPAALLYRDDIFIDSDSPLPSPRLWTFGLYSNVPQTLIMPSLDEFAPEDGWDIDALRRGTDGNWYFRAVRKTTDQPVVRMFRSEDLSVSAERISLGAFQNAALPEPFSAAPGSLQELFDVVFADDGVFGSDRAIAVLSPEFQNIRTFAASRESLVFSGFYSSWSAPDLSGAFLLATDPFGDAVYAEKNSDADPSIRRFALPPMGEGFVYTGIALVEDTIVASWEEQDGYSIGAAGFMVIDMRISFSE